MKKKKKSRSSQETQPLYPGADEKTLSRAQYFSWINNTWEGSTERQTLTNLEFFHWMRKAYGMQLDIYAWDAGNADSEKGVYWKDDAAFRKRFPGGFKTCVEKARADRVRMGIWLGPDGFGHSATEGNARRNFLVGLCRDLQMALFKFDACCGHLRTEKQRLLSETLRECREHRSDLIVLNHRIDLGEAAPHATTTLWEGAETYIDVHMCNPVTASHHRVGALSRGLTPKRTRLTEDHGVCLSSCMDRWDDDLVLQAFNRCLILAPEIYGNPWLLRDDEFPKLARIYNLHRQYRDILVKSKALPEETYGPSAVARGNAATRFVTLRNLSWDVKTYEVTLDRSIGLKKCGQVELRSLHPYERILGRFEYGDTVSVSVDSFRVCLLKATVQPDGEFGIEGCDAEVLRDMTGKPVQLRLKGLPGRSARVSFCAGDSGLSKATLQGKPLKGFTEGRPVNVTFPGQPLRQPWHRKLGALEWRPDVPDDAEALYEATCFAADNDALEVRSLRRAGDSQFPEVQAARDAFFHHPSFIAKGGWDRYLFDGDPKTTFGATRLGGNYPTVGPTALRIDFGSPTRMDQMVIRLKSGRTCAQAEWSSDLRSWTTAPTRCSANKEVVITLPARKELRYLRLEQGSIIPREATGYLSGTPLPTDGWRASNLFSTYHARPAEAWRSARFTLTEAAPGSFLCIALHGDHGRDGAWVAARMNGQFLGCPDRAVSFDSNVWEGDFGLRLTGSNYTYYMPVTPDMIGREIEIVEMTLWLGRKQYVPEVWITSLDPFVSLDLSLE